MFLYNYNGGPEICLIRNEDIYSNLLSISEDNYLRMDVIKEILNAQIVLNTCESINYDDDENKVKIGVMKEKIF